MSMSMIGSVIAPATEGVLGVFSVGTGSIDIRAVDVAVVVGVFGDGFFFVFGVVGTGTF